MPPKVGPRLFRLVANRWPAIRGTGVRVTHIAPDWSEVRIRLPLSLRTRNYVGTIFGGSMYGATDPWYMLQLIHLLGDEYVVWDKAATIRFRKPGRTTLYARFVVGPDVVAEIRTALESVPKIDRTFRTELVDADGMVHAEVEKVIHVRPRERSA